MGRVERKVALVTGAAQGLGAATAKLLVHEGAKVLLCDINFEGVERQADAINDRYPGSAAAAQHDVTDEAAWLCILEDVRKRFGGLHILVNNAGIGSIANIEEESYATWRRVHAVDLDSVFLGSKHAISVIAASGGGSIVNISSISGIIAGHNLAAYNSAKAAVTHLSKSIALHCARARNGVRCNSVHPAFIDTPILDGMAGSGDRAAVRQAGAADSTRANWTAGRRRPCRAVPGLRRIPVRHWRGDSRRRRPQRDVTTERRRVDF